MTFPGADTMNAGIRGLEIRRWAPSCRDDSAWSEPFEAFEPPEPFACDSVGLVKAKPLARQSCSLAPMWVRAIIAMKIAARRKEMS